jgi:hypothetical protein
MFREALLVAFVAAVLGIPSVFAAKDQDEKFWAAARKGNATKVARFLEGDVSADARMVALSVSASNNRSEAFTVLWNHDNSDISTDALDYVLCYAYRNPAPASAIAEVLDARSLTISTCCEQNRKQTYCAGRPIRLTTREFPATRCQTVFIDEGQVPPGATRIAVVWDERVSVLDPAGSARYGTPDISPAGVKDWAMEFASILGEIGADAILITLAERNEDASSSMFPGTAPDPDSRSSGLTGFKFGTVTDRIEIVAIRTIPTD